MGVRVLAVTHYSAILLPIRLKFFMVTQETIIHSLMMKIMILMLFWKKSYFWRESGRGHPSGTKGSRASRPDQNVGSMQHVNLLGQPLSRNNIFKNLGPEPPLLFVQFCLLIKGIFLANCKDWLIWFKSHSSHVKMPK